MWNFSVVLFLHRYLLNRFSNKVANLFIRHLQNDFTQMKVIFLKCTFKFLALLQIVKEIVTVMYVQDNCVFAAFSVQNIKTVQKS